jgi:hypothetical protein
MLWRGGKVWFAISGTRVTKRLHKPAVKEANLKRTALTLMRGGNDKIIFSDAEAAHARRDCFCGCEMHDSVIKNRNQFQRLTNCQQYQSGGKIALQARSSVRHCGATLSPSVA